jgi:myo-inositol-1(or 4)-monophosphatase
MHRELNIAISAAQKAGKFLLENFGTPLVVEYKGQINPVTTLDNQAERIIAEVLGKEFPTYDILGEEIHHVIDGNKPLWIIDPLDGTSNYVHGYPLFAVSISLLVNFEILLGVVFNPILDEIFSAERGGSAFLNGNPIKVSDENILDRALVGSGFPYDAWTSERDNVPEWGRFVKKVLSPRCDGCASLDLCHVANGRLDGFWEFDLEPWDMAAGALIAKEAGALVTKVNGQVFELNGRSVLAANPKLHAEMVLHLNAK